MVTDIKKPSNDIIVYKTFVERQLYLDNIVHVSKTATCFDLG